MNTKLLSPAFLLFLLTSLCFLSGCKEVEEVTVPPRPDIAETLISGEQLREADLEIAFSAAMPLQGNEYLRDLMIVDDRLYAVSSHNYLMSFDLQKSVPVYAWKLAPDISKMCGLKSYDDTLYSIISSDLVIMDMREGTKRMSKQFGFGTVCPPARNDYFYYIVGTDQRIHALRASDLVQIFEGSANDDSEITCVNASDNSVIFVTAAGNVVAMLPDKPVQLWGFRAEGEINSPVIRDNGQVIFSSRDAKVYMVDERRGKLVWEYLTAALLMDAPVATRRYVYQHVDGKGLLAIDRQTGELAWQVPNGIALLSENGRKVYVMASDNTLVVMDSKKMQKIAEVNLPGITHWVSNISGERIYLADKYGRIVCIKPIEY
ncbi:MAG: PQQ-binding-like beta-propeller repeat protein [Sedimentisphaerales bacterium]|nr:PQQ-binding-like beta-propeller repeat protein [Sedimentisphaerales bacterium]